MFYVTVKQAKINGVFEYKVNTHQDESNALQYISRGVKISLVLGRTIDLFTNSMILLKTPESDDMVSFTLFKVTKQQALIIVPSSIPLVQCVQGSESKILRDFEHGKSLPYKNVLINSNNIFSATDDYGVYYSEKVKLRTEDSGE